MSAYKVMECDIRNEDQIIAGLIEIGIPRNQIEIHPAAVPLYDYAGNQTSLKGNVIVRRENFKLRTGARWNADLGFEKQENGYHTHINSEETRWWKQKEPQFKQTAAEVLVTQQAKKKGYHVKKTKKDGKIKLQLTKNF